MSAMFINKMATGLLFAVALLISYPTQAHSTYPNPNPSRKEIRLEARLLKLKGKRLQQEGKELVRESRIIKTESGNRKEARKIRKQGRQLLKNGKNIERQGRWLKKGKISSISLRHC